MVRKTFTDSRGKSRHLTKWQQEVSKHGMRKAKKSYAGYKQVPAKTTTTGNVRNVKGGTRRVKDSKVGRGKRSILSYKGDGLNLVAHQQKVAILDSDGIWKEDMELLRNQFPPHL